jgi:plastocyanin
MPTRKWLALTLATLGAATALAACGGGDEGAEPAPAEPPAEPAPAEPPAEPAPYQPAVAGGTVLVGTVLQDFTITLTQDGNPITELPAGTYTIEVDDQASIHNFHLSGPGLDETTDVSGTGKTTWEVTLEPGEYTFVCDPHAGSMKGSFTVQ